MESHTQSNKAFPALWAKATIVIGCWTVLALLLTPQTYYANAAVGSNLTVVQAILANLILFYRWALFTPVLFWLGRRFPLEQNRTIRNLIILFLLEIPITLFQMELLDVVTQVTLGNWQFSSLKRLFIRVGAFDVMMYWAIVAVSQAITYFRKYQDREATLAKSQLQALRTQLQPHFLFNALNAISELVYQSPEVADRTITQLSELLRLALKDSQQQEIPLREELNFVAKYLEIQQTLMDERLRVLWNVQPETEEALVPNMILQPLVENSVQHGISSRASGGEIEISARKLNGTLNLRVQDNGNGFGTNHGESRQGFGLANVRARLQLLYGQAQRIEFESDSGRGTIVDIEIPFQRAGIQ